MTCSQEKETGEYTADPYIEYYHREFKAQVEKEFKLKARK